MDSNHKYLLTNIKWSLTLISILQVSNCIEEMKQTALLRETNHILTDIRYVLLQNQEKKQ